MKDAKELAYKIASEFDRRGWEIPFAVISLIEADRAEVLNEAATAVIGYLWPDGPGVDASPDGIRLAIKGVK